MSNFQRSQSPNYVDKTANSQLNNPETNFLVRFWGVRGLIPSPSNYTQRYGGNTGCVEVQVGGKCLIFDGGTGLRMLGKNWLASPQPIEAHLFFTNAQSNRIHGFPFFAPAFNAENTLHIYGIAASNSASIKQCLYDQMLQPHFPYPLQVMESQLHFHNLMPDNTLNLDDVTITTALINQTQKSIGYRVDWQEYSIAYVTDIHKFADESEKERIAQFTKGVNVLIANPSYPPPTFHKSDAGDLNYQTAVSLAQQSGAKQLVISHHHPDDRDDFLDSVLEEIKANFPQVVLASEGMILPVIKV
ncbi:MAG: MBL fold metallo-hydrolase [Calothrix sp. MO_167.B12]|nr:MBL fold metallo-hydrolase [Calothrix sp. MO_167.B12]